MSSTGSSFMTPLDDSELLDGGALLAARIGASVGDIPTGFDAVEDTDDLVDLIDELIAVGKESSFPLPAVDFMVSVKGAADDAADAFSAVTALAAGDQEALGDILAALIIHANLLELALKLSSSPQFQAAQTRLQGRSERKAPLYWLSSWPAPVAKLRLDGERGAIAASLLRAFANEKRRVSTEHLRELTRLWRIGSEAALRFFALVMPESISEEDVPASDRIDVADTDAGLQRRRAHLASVPRE